MEEVSRSEDAEPRQPASPGVVERLTSQLRGWVAGLDTKELATVVALLALCVFVRLLRLQPIEYYDDEVTRWHFVRQWFYDNDFSHAHWTHHMARFGLNVPLFFVLALLGRHASVYYVLPVAAFALQVLFTYLATKRLGGRGAGVVAAILLSVFTGMDRGACQLLPDGFGGTAMILVCYLLFRYQEPGTKRPLRWLIGAALAFVWAYEIKESNLLFLPGLGLSVWLCRGRFRDGVIFCAVLFLAIGLETAFFRIFTDHSSRFAIVEESHGIATVRSFWNLFERFTRLELPWQVLIYTWLLAVLWLLGSRDRRSFVLVLIPATFVGLLTFLVRSIHPIVLWTRFFSRYFEPVAPLFVAGVALFVCGLVSRIWSAHARPRFAELPAKLGQEPALVAIACSAVVAALELWSAGHGLPNPSLKDARRISSLTNDAYKRNLPIVQQTMRKEIQERRVRSLKAVYGVYLNDKVIATSPLAKHGELPAILDVVRDTKRYSYVLYDPSAYTDQEITEWVERGCALVVTEAKEYLNAGHNVPSLILEQDAKLPAACIPPRHGPRS